MSRCWEQRGCDEEMQADCPHTEIHDPCPLKCAFSRCENPQYEFTTDPELVFDPAVDRDGALKEACRYCAFFIRKGPRVGG